jgi:hypothetical protein
VAKKPVRKPVRKPARRPAKAPRRTIISTSTSESLAVEVAIGVGGAGGIVLGGPFTPLQGSVTIEVPACEVETQVRAPGNTISAAGVTVLPPACPQILQVRGRCYNEVDPIPPAPPFDGTDVQGTVVASRHWEFRAAVPNEIQAASFGPDPGACPNLLVVWVQFVAGGNWIRDMKRVFGLASNRTDLDP